MGVQGVIYRSAGGNIAVEAVRRLSRGQSFLQSPNPADADVSEDLVGARVRDRLSDRELRIIAAVVQGYKNREIAVAALHQRADDQERAAQHLRQNRSFRPIGTGFVCGSSPHTGTGDGIGGRGTGASAARKAPANAAVDPPAASSHPVKSTDGSFAQAGERLRASPRPGFTPREGADAPDPLATGRETKNVVPFPGSALEANIAPCAPGSPCALPISRVRCLWLWW